MNRLLSALAFAWLTVPAAALAATPGDPGENRVALVIGNASYKDAPLANPVHDARAVAKALNGLGFKVSLRVNLTQTQMRRAIREFGDELHATQGVGLFYFAGHGVQISNRNFLIPVGSDIQREYEVEEQAVDAGTVLSMMHSARARVNIVILDACRNNPFIRDFRSTVTGLAPMQAPSGTLIAFATAPGQTAIDGAGQLGLYTEHLVENIVLPGLKIEDVFKNVRIGVQRVSAGKQVPWENTSLTGDFYFVSPATASPAAIAAPAAAVATTAAAAVSQQEIEQAVLAALRRRELELTEARSARAERDAAREAVDRLQKELAELREARAVGQAQAARPAASAQSAAPPAQVALAVPGIPRRQPDAGVGGRVERPELRVGDQWRYQVTDRWTNLKSMVVMDVATVTESRIYTRRFQSADVVPNLTGSAVIDVWDRGWNQFRRGDIELVPFYPALQFPLEKGKRWTGKYSFYAGGGISLAYELRFEVAGWERVTVPAGSFDAVKVDVRGDFQALGVATGIGTVTDVVWYAPSIGHYVRRDIQHFATGSTYFATQGAERNQQYERWELLEYKPN